MENASLTDAEVVARWMGAQKSTSSDKGWWNFPTANPKERHVHELSWLKSGDGCIAVLEAVRAKGYELEIFLDSTGWYVGMLAEHNATVGSSYIDEYADNLTDAVLAAVAQIARAEVTG